MNQWFIEKCDNVVIKVGKANFCCSLILKGHQAEVGQTWNSTLWQSVAVELLNFSSIRLKDPRLEKCLVDASKLHT